MKKSYPTFWLAAIFVLAASTTCFAQANKNGTLDLSTDSEQARISFREGLEAHQNSLGGHSYFQAALDADPDFRLANVFVQFTTGTIPNDERLRRLDEAIARMSGASSGELLFAHAMRARAAGDREQSFSLFSALKQLAPADGHIAYYYAMDAPDIDAQIAAHTENTIRFPEFGGSYNILAYLLSAKGDDAGALKAIRRYVQLKPDHPNAHDSLAEMLQRAGYLAEARNHYVRAVQLAPEAVMGYFGLADVAVLTGNVSDALLQLDLAAELLSGLIHLNRRRANAFLMNGDVGSAREIMFENFKRAEEGKYSDLAGLIAREIAYLYTYEGNIPEARVWADKGDALDPDEVSRDWWRAFLHGEWGEPQKSIAAAKRHAIESAQRALTDPGYAGWDKVGLAMAALSNGEAEEAFHHLIDSGMENPIKKALMVRSLRLLGSDADAERQAQEVRTDMRLDLVNSMYPIAKMMIGTQSGTH